MKPDSSDHRTLEQKLEAMANQTASPNDAANARRKLEALRSGRAARLTANRANPETPPILTRDDVKARDDGSRGRGRGVRVRYPDGTWIHFDERDMDWEFVEALQLQYRFDGETDVRQGGGSARSEYFCVGCIRVFDTKDELKAHVPECPGWSQTGA